MNRLVVVRQKYRVDGGAECFITRMMEALNNSDYELHIITRKWLKDVKSNWHLHICNPSGSNRVARDHGFAVAARSYWLQHDFNIVQSHERIADCDIFRAGDGVHRAWLEERSRIIPAHQRWFMKISNYHRYVLFAEKQVFYSPYLKKIICNSVMVKKDIMNYYNISEDKLIVIYNAIDLQKFVPANDMQRQVFRKVLAIPEKACTLIFVGSSFARKGLRQVLYAIANTDRYLIVLGTDKRQYRYQALACSLGCLSRVRFIGMCYNVLPYYHVSDALILPTLYDPFPNVILEAMSCGLPVITSQRCGGAELIEQGREGFVCDALDSINLQKFITDIPSKNQDSSMGMFARQRVSKFTFSHLLNQLIALYHQL